MAAIQGNESKVAIKKATTWGTEVAAGSGDLAQINSLSVSESVTELEGNSLGAGIGMRSSVDRGNVTHELSLEMCVGFENKADVILASFFGDPQTPVEVTTGEGDYNHAIYADTALHQNGYLTVAEKKTTTAAISYPTCAVSDITLSHGEPTSEIILQATLLASGQDLTPTNDVTALNAATVATQTKAYCKRESYWLINAQGGAQLSTSTDLICPVSASLTLSRAMVVRNKPCNSSASPLPGSDGFLSGELTLELDKLDDLTYFTAAEAGTVYKASFATNGAAIGAGTARTFGIYLPSLQLITSPQHALANAGDNPVTLTFRVLAATAAPTGFGSVRPYIGIVNTRSTVY